MAILEETRHHRYNRFSISKWIHLNNKDEGLKEFFYRVYQCLKMGGVFVLEPQPWDTYSKARRMSETLKENAKYLQLRPEGFGELLEELGFSHRQCLGVTGKGGKLRLFTNKRVSSNY
jgi:7SK snRNA methylphosphate capping enzyme